MCAILYKGSKKKLNEKGYLRFLIGSRQKRKNREVICSFGYYTRATYHPSKCCISVPIYDGYSLWMLAPPEVFILVVVGIPE